MNYKRERTRTKLSDQVAQDLRFRILVGTLLPGTHIVESSIASELGVSNGPVREAIFRLENEGFVKTQKNGRTIVNEITQEFIDDYLDISSYLLRSCVNRIIKQKIQGENIDGLIDDLEKSCNLLSESIMKNDDKGMNTADNDFTTSIIWASGNSVIQNIWLITDGIRLSLYHVTEIYYQSLLKSKKNDFLSNFLKLKEAIQIGSADAVEECIQNHYKFRRTACLHFIKEKNSK